jgi:cation diffusion facilitator family transporter
MITLLRRLFIKNYTNVGDEGVRVKHGQLAAYFGILSNLLLVAMKLTAAFLLQAQSGVLSIALVADAINNLADMASSIVTLVGFRISGKPADKEHPFGHERIEYIAGLVVSTIVLVLAVELIRDSIQNIITNTLVDSSLLTIIILGVAVLMKLLQGYFNYGMGKAIDSEALKATSLDSLTDAVATTAVMISAILAHSPLGWNFLDGYMGIVVGLFVAYSGVKMIKETADPLIGEQNNQELVEEVVKEVKSHQEILGVHDVLCHSYGPTKYFISLHAEINENMSMLDAHDVIDDIEREVKHKFHIDITIHMDPVAVGDPLTDKLKGEVAEELNKISPELKFHDFRIVRGPSHTNIIFDVLLPYDEKVTQDIIMKSLEAHFNPNEKKKTYYFVVDFDRPF